MAGLQSHPIRSHLNRAEANASSDDEGSQPLLSDGGTPRAADGGSPRAARRASRLGPGGGGSGGGVLEPGSNTTPLLPLVSDDSPSFAVPATSILVSVVILSKTIIGAGAAALPRAFDMLGLTCAGGGLLLVAYMTHFTNEALALGTLVTGHMSFSEVVRELVGKKGSLLLLLSLVCRCAGLMIIYVIISADVLAGHVGASGLVCDLLGGEAGDWCSNRELAAGVVVLCFMAPLITPKRLSSTVVTSWIGMVAVGTWVAVTLVLVAAALAKGQAHAIHWLPDPGAFSGGAAEVATRIVAVLPVLATAYTCQMTIHHILRDMQPLTQPRVKKMSAAAILLCTLVFLSIAVGSQVAFGPHLPADILTLFNSERLEPLVGRSLATVFYVLVRLSFLCSIITIAPSQMAPYRESFSRLLVGRELSGGAYYLLSYGSLAAFYAIAMNSGSIWVPIQFVGATAGALIAFIFPALVALKAAALSEGEPLAAVRYWRWNAWALIVVGVLQAAAGITACLFLSDDSQSNSLAADLL
ncbi:hypothetical protein D9Q98_008327 [Chlorella vulgaris]|uniref:Amino acid transporter transmembrane domain-containing protein n=1 Tax=Chlorella vulgaris TaxID=3077 RepID=A0A9D4YTG1_CHLVU|nr:hypothetical protein D9Q98_008327 [Chlorella vulgaris]